MNTGTGMPGGAGAARCLKVVDPRTGSPAGRLRGDRATGHGAVERLGAERLAAGPPTALSLIKRLLDSGATSSFQDVIEDEARAQHIVFTTADMREGMTAFFERREPRFTGE